MIIFFIYDIFCTVVSFVPIYNNSVYLSLYYHFEDEIPVFKPASKIMLQSLPGFYNKAVIYKNTGDSVDIHYDRFKMCYDEYSNNLTVCDIIDCDESTKWILENTIEENKFRLRNKDSCITITNPKTLFMTKCSDQRLDQVFTMKKEKIKLYCHYDENCSDEIALDY
ncbi:hypothetical protein GVAV_003485 [Gurleya vavrai]